MSCYQGSELLKVRFFERKRNFWWTKINLEGSRESINLEIWSYLLIENFLDVLSSLEKPDWKLFGFPLSFFLSIETTKYEFDRRSIYLNKTLEKNLSKNLLIFGLWEGKGSWMQWKAWFSALGISPLGVGYWLWLNDETGWRSS